MQGQQERIRVREAKTAKQTGTPDSKELRDNAER